MMLILARNLNLNCGQQGGGPYVQNFVDVIGQCSPTVDRRVFLLPAPTFSERAAAAAAATRATTTAQITDLAAAHLGGGARSLRMSLFSTQNDEARK